MINKLDIWKLRKALDDTEEKDIGKFLTMVGLAYNAKQINRYAVFSLFDALKEKFGYE